MTRSALATLAGGLLAAIVCAGAPPARAHPVAPALLKLTETAPGTVQVSFRVPPGRPTAARLAPRLPDHCRVLETPSKRRVDGELVTVSLHDCGELGLRGQTIVVDNLTGSPQEVLVFLAWFEGASDRAVLSGDAPSWTIPARPGKGGISLAYTWLGVGHILGGPDHLLFVFGLVLLVPLFYRLFWTITGFTLGHSLTLALATTGVVEVPSAPVEAAIALSILWLAVELGRGEETLLHRRPWLAATGFGLLHGLGFAGALAEVGLPQGEIPLALFAFNLGIEAGQVAFVAVVLAAAALLRPLKDRLPAWAPQVPIYLIGTMAAYWFFERI